MTRGGRWNALEVLMIHVQILMMALIHVATANEAIRMTQGADNILRTGNVKEINESSKELQVANDADTASADIQMKRNGNEIPVRYDETQLWRIYNISNNMQHQMVPVVDTLENKYGAILWKENSKFLDISVDKKNLKRARAFLLKHNLVPEVLHTNIQELIDLEQSMGVGLTQSEPGQRTKKAARSGINWKDYHDLETIYGFMHEIRRKYPNITRIYKIGTTAEGRDLKVLRISENPGTYKKIWIDGGIHAREWISPATVTFILYQLMSKWENQPYYIKDKTWYIMPVMNPDGYVYSRTVERLWRKNRSPSKHSTCLGVDLNRNFDIGWNIFGSSNDPCSDIYCGSIPGSEKETDAVAKFLNRRKNNLESYLSFHSYGQMMVYPWAYTRSKVEDASLLQNVANTAIERIEKKTGSIYRAAVTHELLGVAGGGSDDWVRAALGTKYTYTVELRDRGKFGFILPTNQILETAMEGYTIVDTVAQAIN